MDGNDRTPADDVADVASAVPEDPLGHEPDVPTDPDDPDRGEPDKPDPHNPALPPNRRGGDWHPV